MRYRAKYDGDTDFFQQECEDDKSLRRSKAIRRLLLVLLIADVVMTSKTFVLYGCIGGAAVLVGLLVMNTLISGRKKDIKDKYLKS